MDVQRDETPRADRYLEEGRAFADIAGLKGPARTYDVVVIGAGQAGLAVGHHLARTGLDFVLVDGCERVGDAWRKRWDSLRLFTPARFDGLPGLPFPADGDHFPTKDEMADYLEAYAERFSLPVRTRTRVERLSRADGRFLLETSRGTLRAHQVIVAMASYQKPRWPDFAEELDPDIRQIHSAHYESPAQLRDGDVLIVGAGNSGSEIAMELARSHRVWISGRDVGQLPFRLSSLLGRLLLAPLVLRVLFHHVLTIGTPVGRRMRPMVLSKGGPLIRVKNRDLRAAGVRRVPRTAGARDRRPVLEDGRVLDVANVVWCTGFHPGLSWIDLPILDDHGYPRHEAGVVGEAPGLYFVGLTFLYSLSSGMVHGVGRDAERIVHAVAERAPSLIEESARRATLVA